ncbi:M3 family metallopeptidase [Carboxydochorda subterranea]|uniref:M3 family metallopeptidase n=1 Tax=Carboxydichorda subterranea TaxID=3109565 RepID=A0ABZ1C1G6_9FIRM|nr:M3 family metallopeptidase [Limnochorda sp. L945t]WRP18779.1 M3 family metallopeptidase [Limnochorda sp. L945t]
MDAPAWHDVSAPLAVHERRWGFDEAAAFVTEQFESFSPDMARLARRAFEGRWIEAEDRPGKRAGGFCTSFPIARQSRIFMTFAGMPANVETLAHELGHAFHHSVVEDLPPLVQHYPMSLAETASTFAELVVSEGAIRQAESPHERIALLDRRLSAATDYLMNIRARFLFETAFYREREQGQVSVARLNALMEQAQKEAYRHALSSYHPHFWASKLHFYLTGHPFYNFPYTFGFLFSHGVYARARSEGSRFASTYAALLRDTGRMTVEELARRHLGADLTRRAFWDEACAAAVAPLDDFLRLTADGMPPEERGR